MINANFGTKLGLLCQTCVFFFVLSWTYTNLCNLHTHIQMDQWKINSKKSESCVRKCVFIHIRLYDLLHTAFCPRRGNHPLLLLPPVDLRRHRQCTFLKKKREKSDTWTVLTMFTVIKGTQFGSVWHTHTLIEYLQLNLPFISPF